MSRRATSGDAGLPSATSEQVRGCGPTSGTHVARASLRSKRCLGGLLKGCEAAATGISQRDVKSLATIRDHSYRRFESVRLLLSAGPDRVRTEFVTPASKVGFRRPVMITAAPSLIRRPAEARPIPLVAPVNQSGLAVKLSHGCPCRWMQRSDHRTVLEVTAAG